MAGRLRDREGRAGILLGTPLAGSVGPENCHGWPEPLWKGHVWIGSVIASQDHFVLGVRPVSCSVSAGLRQAFVRACRSRAECHPISAVFGQGGPIGR